MPAGHPALTFSAPEEHLRVLRATWRPSRRSYNAANSRATLSISYLGRRAAAAAACAALRSGSRSRPSRAAASADGSRRGTMTTPSTSPADPRRFRHRCSPEASHWPCTPERTAAFPHSPSSSRPHLPPRAIPPHPPTSRGSGRDPRVPIRLFAAPDPDGTGRRLRSPAWRPASRSRPAQMPRGARGGPFEDDGRPRSPPRARRTGICSCWR